ncbi:MAG: LysR family transcriptional regulator [Nitrospirae bacterium]|nr:LysR family transcriptional regulator [Nitrospirota bacterium]
MQKTAKSLGSKKKAGARLRGHIWLDGSEGTFLGYGRVALMERIREYGSITRAAKALEISYRRAWVMIDSMNRQAPKPFVVTSAGGRGGGGTLVTEDGERAVRLFWKFHEDFQKFLEKEGNKLGVSPIKNKKEKK